MAAGHVDKRLARGWVCLKSIKRSLLRAVLQQHVAPDEVSSRRQIFGTGNGELPPIEIDNGFDGMLGPRIDQIQVSNKVGWVSPVHPNEVGQKRIKGASVGDSAVNSAPGKRHPVFNRVAEGNGRVQVGNL
jgi:hypothetical protein